MNNKIIVAIDSDHLNNSIKLVKKIKKEIFAIKIGYEFFFNFGIEGYQLIQKEKIKIFLDLKLHDIPNTVDKGIRAISKLNPYQPLVNNKSPLCKPKRIISQDYDSHFCFLLKMEFVRHCLEPICLDDFYIHLTRIQ